MIERLWSFKWTTGRVASQEYILTHTIHATRASVWDDLLRSWFGQYNSSTQRYYRGNVRYTRASAIQYLRRRGGSVIRVRVVENPCRKAMLKDIAGIIVRQPSSSSQKSVRRSGSP